MVLWLLLSWTVSGFEGLTCHRPLARLASSRRGGLVGRLEAAAASAPTKEPVYESELWRQHRSPTRYLRAMVASVKSTLSRGLALNLGLVAFAAVAVASLDFSGFFKLRMSSVPLAMTSPAVALLLVFRTNMAYGRWWEARTVWSGIKNRVRDLNRQGTSIPSWTQGGDRFAALAVAFAYTLKVHLREMALGPNEAETQGLAANLTAVVGRQEADAIMAQEHRPYAVTKAMTAILCDAQLEPQLQARVDAGISELVDHVGRCEKIITAPVPLGYGQLSAKALCAWMLFLPSAFLGAGFGFAQVVFGTTLTAVLLLGVDRVATQLEEPFSIMPLDDVCRSLRGEYEKMVLDKKQQASTARTIPAGGQQIPRSYDTQPPYLLA